MATQAITDTAQVCEDALRVMKAYNVEHAIWPSENIVIDRLLARRLELADAYAEIAGKLEDVSFGIETLLGVVVNVTVLWHPDRVVEACDARARLDTIDREIAALADDLAGLIEERTALSNSSGFASDAIYHVVDVIEAAASSNGFYRSYMHDELDALRGRYDLKYWPALSEIVRVIGQDAAIARIEATDPLTRVAATGARRSKADFFKALFVSLDENNARNCGQLPRDFKLSDDALASLANCALDLDPNSLLDGAYVKRLRQREREAGRTR